jgi:hypothetical protein
METGATDVCKRNEETALCNTRNPSRHTPNNEDEPVELCPIVEAEAGQDFIAEDESQQEEKEDDDGDGEVSDKGADKNAAEDEAEVEASLNDDRLNFTGYPDDLLRRIITSEVSRAKQLYEVNPDQTYHRRRVRIASEELQRRAKIGLVIRDD